MYNTYHAVKLAILLVNELLQCLPVLPLGHICAKEFTLEFCCRCFAQIFDEVRDDNLDAT